jgi:hypothetical protein
LKRASNACAWKETKATAPTIKFKTFLRMVQLLRERKPQHTSVLLQTHEKSQVIGQINFFVTPRSINNYSRNKILKTS